eukprot:5973606-Pyramimonas_sp.AAC.1
MSECQSALHEWCRANRVTSDSGKESFHILSRSAPVCDHFIIIGILFDPKLLMDSPVDACIAACSWTIYSLTRARRFRADADLVGLYKAHVLSFIECRACAISHASTSVLEPLDIHQSRSPGFALRHSTFCRRFLSLFIPLVLPRLEASALEFATARRPGLLSTRF